MCDLTFFIKAVYIALCDLIILAVWYIALFLDILLLISTWLKQ